MGTFHWIDWSVEARSWLRPQMITICPIGLSRASSNNASPSAFAVFLTGPIPSPPPINRTAGKWWSISSSSRSLSCVVSIKIRTIGNRRKNPYSYRKSGLYNLARLKTKSTFAIIARQNDGRTGKPNTRVWECSRPSTKALLATSSDGQ